MIAYCGLDCSKCDGYLAAQSGSQEEIAKVAKKWSAIYNADVKPENIICDGCMVVGRKSFHCQNLCKIRNCAIEKKVKTCAECGVFPCDKLSPVFGHAPEAKTNLEQIRKTTTE